MDEAGNYVIPAIGYWRDGDPARPMPGNTVSFLAESSVDYDQTAVNAVSHWITNNATHMVIQWTDGVEAGCPSRPPVTDASTAG